MHHRRFISWLMLCSSFAVLLSMIVPHHHHADGMPCADLNIVFSWICESESSEVDASDCCEDDGCGDAPSSSHQHDCSCYGHNIVFYSNENTSGHDNYIPFLLVPLCVLFDSYRLPSVEMSELAYAHCGFYAEALYDACITGGSRLRAPPSCFNC